MIFYYNNNILESGLNSTILDLQTGDVFAFNPFQQDDSNPTVSDITDVCVQRVKALELDDLTDPSTINELLKDIIDHLITFYHRSLHDTENKDIGDIYLSPTFSKDDTTLKGSTLKNEVSVTKALQTVLHAEIDKAKSSRRIRKCRIDTVNKRCFHLKHM